MYQGYLPDEVCPVISGPNGANLDAIRKQSGANMKLWDNYENGMRRVQILGWESQVRVAKQIIETTAGSWIQNESTMPVDPVAAGLLPPPEGAAVKAVSPVPQGVKSIGVNKITFTRQQESQMIHYVLFTSRYIVAELCTSRGEKVNRIRDQTMCQVLIDDDRTAEKRKIICHGTVKQVTMAVLCIKDMVESCGDDPTKSLLDVSGQPQLPYWEGIDCRTIWDPNGLSYSAMTAMSQQWAIAQAGYGNLAQSGTLGAGAQAEVAKALAQQQISQQSANPTQQTYSQETHTW